MRKINDKALTMAVCDDNYYGCVDYMDDDINLEQSDFKLKIEMMYYLVLITKLYVVRLLHQA